MYPPRVYPQVPPFLQGCSFSQKWPEMRLSKFTKDKIWLCESLNVSKKVVGNGQHLVFKTPGSLLNKDRL